MLPVFREWGYPFYSLGGGRMAVANLSYKFPLISKLIQDLSVISGQPFFPLYGDIGNAWEGKNTKLNQFKKI
ncbi:MAG: hypothetical protein IPN57_14630 [Ignavibacteria bacterium]|nr:hypothetical protein [Ignavibacteria bacterium]